MDYEIMYHVDLLDVLVAHIIICAFVGPILGAAILTIGYIFRGKRTSKGEKYMKKTIVLLPVLAAMILMSAAGHAAPQTCAVPYIDCDREPWRCGSCVTSASLSKLYLCDGCASYCVMDDQKNTIIKCYFDSIEGDELMETIFKHLYETPVVPRRK